MSRTPGHWNYDDVSRFVFSDSSETIAAILDTSEGLEGDCPEADDNGRLVAAAPQLLDVCKLFRLYANETKGKLSSKQVSQLVRVAGAAIAKATNTASDPGTAPGAASSPPPERWLA